MLYIQFPFRLVRVELVITRNGNRLPGNMVVTLFLQLMTLLVLLCHFFWLFRGCLVSLLAQLLPDAFCHLLTPKPHT